MQRRSRTHCRTIFYAASLLLLCRECLCVAVTEVHLITKDNKKDDYVLQGHEASLTCQFILSPDEILTSVQWLQEGEEVYLWRKGQPPKAQGSLRGRVDLTNMSPSQVRVENAHMDMHGKYTCRVETDMGGVDENDFQLIVIVDACKESSWETYTDMIQCIETVNLHCIGMFPKPSPQCGVIDQTTNNYVTSVPFDQTSQLRNGTFEIRMHRRFHINDWIKYDDITFSCEVVVKETTWKKGIQHKLFGDRGCVTSPPDIPFGYYNVTEGLTCWGHPRDGVEAHYTCTDGKSFSPGKPDSLVCSNGQWLAFPGVVSTGQILSNSQDRTIPVCGGSRMWISPSTILIAIFLLFHREDLVSGRNYFYALP